MATNIHFAFTEETKQAIPHVRTLKIPIGAGVAPDTGDLVQFELLRERWFKVLQRQITYQMSGDVMVVALLDLVEDNTQAQSTAPPN